MRKTIYRILYAVVVFCVTVVLLEVFTSGTSTQTTTEMSEAVLPVVSMNTGSTVFNTLYGSVRELDPGKLRAPLTPITSDRTVDAKVQLYGQTLISMSMEVRDITGKRLIEEDELTYQVSGDQADVSISFKNLIDPDTEYLLVLFLSTQQNEEVRYYTRFSYTEDDSEREMAEEALEFARSFHDMTFDKSNEEELSVYLESSDKVSNSSLATVTLYNSADQVTWGDLNPTETTTPVYTITAIENGYIGIRGSYYVSTEPESDETVQRESLYRCTEYYELRKGTDRFYLMDYERTMSKDFDPQHPSGTSGNLELGIADTDMQVVQSSKKDVTAFVHDGRLYETSSSDNLLIYIYGFDSAGDTGERETNASHDIQILHMEEDGSIDFLVYGYMNCGRHEGDTGISFYHYNGNYHTVEEKAFVPYNGSFEILNDKIERISHYDAEKGRLYLILEDALYEIDVNSCSLRQIEGQLSDRSCVISDSGVLVACREMQDGEVTGSIRMYNLNGMNEITITPAEGYLAIPLGFMGQDLIYGTVRTEDIITDSTGTQLQLMEHIYIVDQELNVLEDYHQDGYYVTGCEIRDGQILLKRVQKAEGSSDDSMQGYTPAAEDTISSGTSAAVTQLTQTLSSSRYGTIVQISVGISDWLSCQYMRPQEILYEGSRELTPQQTEDIDDEQQYYVYDCKGFVEQTRSIADAITQASGDNTGVVLNSEGQYVWAKTRPSRSEIDDLTTMTEGASARSSQEVCLEAMLLHENKTADAASLLAEGKTSLEILEGKLIDSVVMNLSGCTLDDVLYYVGQGYPVYACRKDDTMVLIVGYGPENVELYDPSSGSVHLLTISEATEQFQQAGNRFISYISSSK